MKYTYRPFDTNRIICLTEFDIDILNNYKYDIYMISFNNLDLDKVIWDNKFNNVREIEINNCKFSHIPLTKYSKLETLVIKNSYLSNIKNICEDYKIYNFKKFVNLKYLDLSHNIIKNVYVIFENIKNLIFLNLSYNEISNIWIYENNYNLRILILNGLHLKCINFLNKLKNIKQFECNFNRKPLVVSNIFNQSIIILGLEYSKINHIHFNKNLKNLLYLQIRNNPLEYCYIDLPNLISF